MKVDKCVKKNKTVNIQPSGPFKLVQRKGILYGINNTLSSLELLGSPEWATG